MARKLLCLVALISLVLLTQAPAGRADTYQLYGGSSTNYLPAFGTGTGWTEAHGPNPSYVLGESPESVPDSVPGYINGSFRAYDFTNNSYNIPTLINLNGGTLTPNGDLVTVTVVYGSRPADADFGEPVFWATGYGGPAINSFDTVITTTATYKADANGLPLYAYDPNDNLYHYTLQNGTMSMTGYGYDINGTYFTLSGTMEEMLKNTQHIGYFSDLTLTYPADPSAVPLPGAAWLLGSGLLGLACLRPRRKR